MERTAWWSKTDLDPCCSHELLVYMSVIWGLCNAQQDNNGLNSYAHLQLRASLASKLLCYIMLMLIYLTGLSIYTSLHLSEYYLELAEE